MYNAEVTALINNVEQMELENVKMDNANLNLD